jgi:hypothetical protein
MALTCIFFRLPAASITPAYDNAPLPRFSASLLSGRWDISGEPIVIMGRR